METHDFVGVGVGEVRLLGLRLNAHSVGYVTERIGDALLLLTRKKLGRIRVGSHTQVKRWPP